MADEWLRVPIGPDPAPWATRLADRTILAVVHNVTSLTRLLDVTSILESDPRLQVVFTWTESSPFAHDVKEFLADIGALVAPWKQALATEFDLAISASYGGELHELKAPIIVVSHGIGYNKKLSREPGTGNREPGTGNREPGTGNREPSGFLGSGCCMMGG